MPSLRELQVAFFRALETGAAGAMRVASDLRATVESRGTLDADGRIDVYAQMYWMRIADVLREDFPRLATLVGDDRFHVLARAYLAATPSQHPSLRHVGDGFADHLASHAPAELPAFLPDLARLERARLDVFDAPDAPDAGVLTIADLRRVPAEEWGDLRLHVIPALRILQLSWPVHTVWPDDATTTVLQPAPTTLRIWRDEYRVYQAPMDDAESAAFARLVGDAAGDPVSPRAARDSASARVASSCSCEMPPARY